MAEQGWFKSLALAGSSSDVMMNQPLKSMREGKLTKMCLFSM